MVFIMWVLLSEAVKQQFVANATARKCGNQVMT